jgi:hypothetical protein
MKKEYWKDWFCDSEEEFFAWADSFLAACEAVNEQQPKGTDNE